MIKAVLTYRSLFVIRGCYVVLSVLLFVYFSSVCYVCVYTVRMLPSVLLNISYLFRCICQADAGLLTAAKGDASGPNQ